MGVFVSVWLDESMYVCVLCVAVLGFVHVLWVCVTECGNIYMVCLSVCGCVDVRAHLCYICDQVYGRSVCCVT